MIGDHPKSVQWFQWRIFLCEKFTKNGRQRWASNDSNSSHDTTGACVESKIYLKYHKAALTPTIPVTSTAISSVKMSIGHKSPTNLRSEMIFLQGKPVFYIFLPSPPPILTDNPQIVLTMDIFPPFSRSRVLSYIITKH